MINNNEKIQEEEEEGELVIDLKNQDFGKLDFLLFTFSIFLIFYLLDSPRSGGDLCGEGLKSETMSPNQDLALDFSSPGMCFVFWSNKDYF